MRRLLALGAAASLAVILALPTAALATASTSPSASPTTSAGASSPRTPAASASATASPTPSATKSPPGHRGSAHHNGTTVIGPHMCICSVNADGTVNGADFKNPSTVTVSQTRNLVNQMVQVSWTGFTPSSQPTYDSGQTIYPVMIAECRGTNPTTPADCYDASNGGIAPTFNQYGPANTVYNTTQPNGTGTMDVLLYNQVQNQFLGCDPTHPCSLVVVGGQGGDSLDYSPPASCAHHNNDPGGVGAGLGAAQFDFPPPGSTSGYCSWAKRIVIPLYFAPTPSGCPLRAADFTAGGSPMLADTMQQWQTGLCFGANSIELNYNGSLNESEARNYFQAGTLDVAFTTQPLTGTAPHPFTYAPVAVSAVSVAYWVDNALTGQPYTNIKLNARLLLKILTTSYAYTSDACPGAASQTFGCDSAVDGNPVGLFEDPDFLKLNPGQWNIGGTEYEIPNVVSGNSDMTWATTSWIASDKDAANFLAGQFDPWGMHVNTDYLGLKYPVNGFLPADPYFPVSSQYVPIYPLQTVATDQSLNQPSGNQDTRDPITQTYDALPAQIVGQRDLWAILDQADAKRFLFPTAALENAAGKFVLPTDQAMAAAVNDMTVSNNGILSTNLTKKDPAAYPLTMVIYAAVPTGGISKTKAAKIAQFLDFVANQGQRTGGQPGELAPGYLPLPQSLRAQTLKAANEVLNQTGNPKKKTTTSSSSPSSSSKSTSPSPSASSSSSSSKSKSKSPTPSPSPSASSSSTAHSIAVSFSRPDSIGMSWVVLALVIAGGVLLVAGPAALVTGSPAARAALGSGARRLRRLGAGTRNIRRGIPRPTWRRGS
jgi:PBP superfamily domain